MKELKLTKAELNSLFRALDLTMRLYLGQYDRILEEGNQSWFSADAPDLKDSLLNIRAIFIPSLPKRYGMNTSLGIGSKETPLIAQQIYDIYCAIRYLTAYHEASQRAESNSVNPNCFLSVAYDPPLFYGHWYMPEEIAKYCREYLDQAGIYPEFNSGSPFRRQWAIPFLVEFDGEQAVLKYNEDQIAQPLALAIRVKEAVGRYDVAEAFHILYPETDRKEYQEYAKLVNQYLQRL